MGTSKTTTKTARRGTFVFFGGNEDDTLEVHEELDTIEHRLRSAMAPDSLDPLIHLTVLGDQVGEIGDPTGQDGKRAIYGRGRRVVANAWQVSFCIEGHRRVWEESE